MTKKPEKSITIGIDGNEANEDERVGVHNMVYEMLWGLYRLRSELKNGENFVVYLKKTPKKDLPSENFFWEYKVIPGGGLWILRKLMPTLLREKNLDVFFAPNHYLPPLSRVPMVCTITDLGFLEFSGQFKKYDFWQLKYWTAISAFISKYIICISESTRKDIVRHYSFAAKKARVVYLGYDRRRYNQQVDKNVVRRVKEKYQIRSDYILYLGTLKPSKNIEGLIGSFALLKRKDYKIKLVIGGKRGWLYEEIFQRVKGLGLENDVIFTDFVSEDEKPALLAGAKVFVSPSFWEGFGLHVLEAMACGVPVVVSRVASLTEVAGRVGIYVDPKSPASIADGIEKVLEMRPKEYNKLVELGVKQASRFSWKRTAQRTLKILEEAARS